MGSALLARHVSWDAQDLCGAVGIDTAQSQRCLHNCLDARESIKKVSDDKR